jgi:hypothetical protein
MLKTIAEGDDRMVKISIEVRYGHTSFDVTVQAQSIQQAVNLVRGRYPGSDVRVKFPINPTGFFVIDSAAPAGIVGCEGPDLMAA